MDTGGNPPACLENSIVDEHDRFIVKLIGASRLLEDRGTLEQGLHDLVEITAHVLHTDRCSIMLLEEPEESDIPRLRVYANYGALPEAAKRQAVPTSQGIAGHVATTGQSLLIDDIGSSPFAGQGRQAGQDGGDHRGLVSVPILAKQKVVGVININCPQDQRTFDAADVELLEVFALFVGKSIHTFQLQKILQSRFVQLAVERESRERPTGKVGGTPDAGRLAKIVAKTIFRELTAGGFSPSQIISVTSEVINLLQQNLDKHRKRQAREQGATE